MGTQKSNLARLMKNGDLVLTMALFGTILLMILPVPPFLLDGLLAISIALALLVMLVILYVKEPADFTGFPTLLLFITLFRLALNIASTRLILLDEPSLGLAPLVVQEIYEIIHQINHDRGVAMLIVEQNVRAALSIAHHGYVMENGRIVLNGAAETLMNNEDVKEFYMGLAASGLRKSYREIKHYRRRKRWLS